MKSLFSIILFFIASKSISGQNEGILIQFESVQIENKVQLNFTIKAGNTCNGIQIYRSSDSTDFTEIGDIQGVCGSSDHNESYSFTDNVPLKNKTNYYRLQLGTLGYTYIAKVFFIDLSENKALVFPNPVTGNSAILFLNNSHEELQVKVFNGSGRLVYEGSPSRTGSSPLNRSDFKPGVHFFEIVNTGHTLYQGKFTVQ